MKKIIAAFAVSSALLAASSAYAQGIPVIDAASIAQAVQSFQQLQQQYGMLEQTYNQMRGGRGMGALLNKPELRQYLPQEWRGIYDDVNSTSGGISGAAQSIQNGNAVLTAQQLARLQQGSQTKINRQRQTVAMNQAMTEEAYRQSGQRVAYLQSLVDKIDQTQDPKDVMDLQAAITAEQAFVQNENIKLQLMAQLQAAEERRQQLQNREEFLQTLGPGTAKFTR